MVQDPRTHHGLDIVEKRLAPGTHATQQRVPVSAPLPHRVAQPGQQVEAEQNRRAVLLAVPTVVRQLVALGLEPVVVCVGDLPPPPPRVRHVPHVVNRQAMRGDTALGRAWCARGGIDDRARAPMDRPGLVTTAPEDVVDVPPQRHGRAAPMPGVPGMRGPSVVGRPTRAARRECGRGGGLTRQDAVAPVGSHQRPPGLVAGESLAQAGDPFKGEVFCKPLIIYRFSLPASAALSPRFLMQPSAWP